MERITYGAPRLVDWVAQIKAGAATVRVHFSGGALTSYGVTPAEYTTDNPFMQKVIEQSDYFKEGRIILLRRTKIANPTISEKPAKIKAKLQSAPKKESGATADVEIHKTEESPAGETDAHEAEVRAMEGKEESIDSEFSGDCLIVVEVSCLQDAQAYLQENFNISSYKVRSYEAAQKAAGEHGVRFSGAKFGCFESDDSSEGEETGE